MRFEKQKKIKTLYFGLDPFEDINREVVHCPLIKVTPMAFGTEAIQKILTLFPKFTDVIFTSKSAVRIVYQYFLEVEALDWKQKKIYAVGKKTAEEIFHLFGDSIKKEHIFIAKEETAEGVVVLLKEGRERFQRLRRSQESQNLNDLQEGEPFYFWPHSALSRPVISNFLEDSAIPYFSCAVYDTEFIKPNPIPDLDNFQEIFFTSPSTVDAFFSIYSSIPEHIKVKTIGPITKRALELREVLR